MNYFITGSTGLVGSYFIQKLANKKNRLICLLHRKKYSQRLSKNIKFVQGNLNNFKSLVSGCKDADIIIHAAAAINPKKVRDYYLINHQGTKNLLKAAQQNKVKLFIFFSSWAVNPKGGDYAKSKILAEKEVKNYPSYLIIRPADLYSKTQSHLLNLTKIVKSYPFIPIIGNGNYQVSPLYLDDLYKAIFFIIKRKLFNRTISILGPKIYTFENLIKLIMKQSQNYKPVVKLPEALVLPVVKLTDKLGINFPLNIEKYKRLITPKITENVFDFKKAQIKPLAFEEALKKYLLKT